MRSVPEFVHSPLGILGGYELAAINIDAHVFV
jgi:hypothetical protein